MSENNFAPIAMFVYNRADHFTATYQALAKCPEAKNSDLFIFSDGAKNESGEAKVAEVRSAINELKNDGSFRSVTVKESPVNNGLAKSIIVGVTEIINEYGRIIVIEDDCVASPYLLRYMNAALDKFAGDNKVGSVSGFMPEINYPSDFTGDAFLSYRSCSWGWATWKDRFENVAWDLSNIGEFYRDPALIKKLNSCGADRFIRLYRQTKGNGSSWSVRFGAHLVLNDQMTLYPRFSYISNIGCDASGVHSKAEDADSMRVDLSKAIAEPDFSRAEYRKDIQKIMKKHYSGGLVSDVKRSLATAAIVAKERIRLKK